MSNMNKSESITALAKALVKFHSNAPAIIKNATNPHFKNRFADLGGILEAVRTPLAEVGLSVLQLLGDNTLTTLLLHESGEFIETTAPLIVSKHDMQGLGSACSYQRRYSLQSLLSLTGIDDDGNEACKPANEKFTAVKSVKKDYHKELSALMEKNKVSDEDIFKFLTSVNAKTDARYIGDLSNPIAQRLVEKFEDVVAHSMGLAA